MSRQQIHILQDIPQNTVPWWIQHLENFENITIPNVSELPPEAEAEQELLQEQNIESLIVTPMVSNDELVGFIGFDWVEKQEAWSDEFINVLRMVGELITTARERKEREQELQELKSQYETLAENFPDGAVFLIGTDLKCVRAGGEELSKAGLSPDDIEGAKPHDLFPEKIADELCHYYEEALDGNANTFEQVYGGERYRIQTVPVRTDGEDIDHVMAVSQNVTERVEDKQNLEALFESSPDMINIHTADGTIINVNQRFCEAFDQSKDELVGQKVWDIDQEIEPGELQDMWDGMDVGDRTELETEFQTKGGTRFPVEVHLTRLPVDSGTQFMVISRDITERKQRMQQIQALKERLELAVEGANLGVWDWDMATDEVEFNDQWAEMLGYTLEDIEPHLDAWKKRVHPDDIDEVKAALDAHIQQKTGYYDTEHRMRTADDEWKWIRDIGKIFERDANDDPVRAVGIHLNIDETKQYQRELEGKTERLEEFASIVSHDLRSPLSVAAGNLELARDDCESPHLENIERAHGRMSALIDDLLTLAREGEAVTDTEAVNLATVVRKCWDVVETTEASLTIENNRTVMADEPRLKQLFENLIRNAVEHGGSTVTVTVGGLQNGFYIEDDGPGIPEDDAEAVFEAGYSTNDKGTGFGLSIVQRIVEAHGWDIRITNSSKGGARFEITDVELITE